jgi:hypothetical protein
MGNGAHTVWIGRTALALLSIAFVGACAAQAPRHWPTTLEGTYTATVTREDAVQAGVPETAPGSSFNQVDNGTGDFTLTLQDGRATMLQTASHQVYNPTWLATYKVSGRQITFIRSGPLVNHSVTTFRWHLDQGDLTLEFVSIAPPDPILKVLRIAIFTSHPWERVYQTQTPARP